MTMLLVTHDPVAASYCNRVVFIKDGQLYNEITYGESQSAFYQKSSMCYRCWEVRDMNFRQFAINNVLRSKRTYIAHFLSSAFSVMIFFTYGLLSFHPQLKDGLVSSSDTMSMLGTMGMTVSQYIVFVFSFFFLLYSVGAFIKVRKRSSAFC